MNEVKLSGKVLNCYIHDKTGALIVKIAVVHDHKIGRQVMNTESVFNVVMCDEDAMKRTDVQQGDIVNINGYLKVDITKSSFSDNEHRKLKVYASDIEVVKRR